MQVYLSYGLAGLGLLLGFIALLTQRVYLDANTGKPTAVELPLIGKLQTNYPALIFVFLSFGWLYYVHPPKDVEWNIRGELTAPPAAPIDWEAGVLTLFPTDVNVAIGEQGDFEITVHIEEGTSFEDAVERIDFSHSFASFQVYPEKELEAHERGDESLLKHSTEHSRTFGPIPVNMWEGP